MKQRPNVVIFNPDQWRGDVLGHMGNRGAVTPNLDRAVCEDFVSFRTAFCQSPICTPSRCSFMTGWYPHVRGHRTMFHMLRREDPCLLKILKDDGYQVWWGGKNDLIPAQNGFEDYCDVKYEPTDPIERTTHQLHKDLAPSQASSPPADYYAMYLGQLRPQTSSSQKHGVYYDEDWANVLGAIDHIRHAPADRPFCVYLPLLFPHPPYAIEEKYYAMINRNALPPRIHAPTNWAGMPSLLPGIAERQALSQWSESQWDELRTTYYAMCARVDAQFALVMQALREAGLYDNTAVFFFSDHGDFTGDYGMVEKTANTFEECLTRVPLLIKPPSHMPAKARVSNALVELIDVSATIYDYCGITPNYTHFGRSLRSVISGQTDEHRDAVFSEGGRLEDETHAMDDQSILQSGPDSPYWPRLSVQQGIPAHTKATMCRTERYKYVRRLYEQDELYDLFEDPAEQVNLIDQPEMSQIKNDLALRMLKWYQATADVVPHDFDQR
jgi:arylsulfatase A-like enzyme